MNDLLRCVLPSLGLERDKFDNKTVTFEEHIKVEHNMWHYLFFIVLVKVKDSTEYTGPESYVAEMIRVRLAIANVHTLAELRRGMHKMCMNTSSFMIEGPRLHLSRKCPSAWGSCVPLSLQGQLTLLFLLFTSSVSGYVILASMT